MRETLQRRLAEVQSLYEKNRKQFRELRAAGHQVMSSLSSDEDRKALIEAYDEMSFELLQEWDGLVNEIDFLEHLLHKHRDRKKANGHLTIAYMKWKAGDASL